VEIEPDRLIGWINRFGGRNCGLAELTATLSAVTARGGDGTTATIAVPYPPMDPAGREPLEALLAHVASIGPIALVVVRAAAHSIGVCSDGVVLASSTDTHYVQSRTAAGGWSQHRYARRRENQRRDSLRAAADTAVRVFTPVADTLHAVAVGGEAGAIREVLADRRLAFLSELPRRTVQDVGEPRRAVLDDVAARSLNVEITVRNPPRGSS
jgi:hypothetical protein